MTKSATREAADKVTFTQTEVTAGDTAARAGRKNLIINGAMDVAQRATTATGLGASSGYFTLDRYNTISSTTGRFTMSQSTDAPIGFAKSMKVDCTTADTSIGANEYAIFTQAVEAQDIQDMARGTSGAKEVTVSFYVKGNASTTYVCELQDEAGRELSKTFNVTTAWERVELTFPADTNVAAANTYDNTAGIYLYIWIQAGSNFSSGTIPTTWADQSNANRCAGIGNFFSSTSNELYITGVQMEVGSVATDFEHRSYGEELQLCQRYFYNLTYLHPTYARFNFHYEASAWISLAINFPVTMRTMATFSHSLTNAKNKGSSPSAGEDKWCYYIQNTGFRGNAGSGNISGLGGNGITHGQCGTVNHSPNGHASHIFIGTGCTFQFDAEL